MNKIISKQIIEDENLMKKLVENSYYIKYLNRDSNSIINFKKEMKELYQEKTSDKINNIIDKIEMVSSIIDTIK